MVTFLVTTSDDIVDANDGVLSLREAVLQANALEGADRIEFDAALTDPVALSRNDAANGQPFEDFGRIAVTDDVTIDGGTGRTLITSTRPDGEDENGFDVDGFFGFSNVRAAVENIDFEGSSSIAVLVENSDVDVVDTTISNSYFGGILSGISAIDSNLNLSEVEIFNFGGEATGGAVSIQNSNLNVENSYLTTQGDEFGRGIEGSGSVYVNNSTISDNGLFTGAGIQVTGDVTVKNSVFEQNGGNEDTDGYGIRVIGNLDIENSTILGSETRGSNYENAAISVTGSANITNVTVANNLSDVTTGASEGDVGYSAIFIENPDGLPASTIVNSIIDGEVRITDGAELVSEGSNIFTFENSGFLTSSQNDFFGVDPVLLFGDVSRDDGQENGGPTRTLALNNDPSNPALNNANPDLAPETDQRGFERVDGPDIGSFELQEEVNDPDTGTVVTTADDIVRADGQLSLREAILFANETEGEQTITFADSLADETLLLENGSIVVSDDLTIQGNNQTISSAGADPVLSVQDSAITIDDINFTLMGTNGEQITAAVTQEGGSFAFTNGTVDANGGVDLNNIDTFSLDNVEFLETNLRGLDVRNYTALQVSETKGSIVNSNLPDVFIRGFDHVEVLDSSISNGRGYRGSFGGGLSIDTTETVNIERSTFSKNQYSGLRIDAEQTVIRDSVISDNGFGTLLGGGAEIENILLTNNYGGLSFSGEGRKTLTNATIADNGSGSAGVSIGAGEATITNATITGNSGNTLNGGGINVSNGASLELNNSIVLGNGEFGGSEGGLPEISSEGTLIADRVITSSGSVGAFDQGEVIASNPEGVFAETSESGGIISGVLADNGGDTLTVALLADPNNPALNNANAELAPETDQRGFERVGAPDIGAFELQEEVNDPDTGTVVTTADDIVAADGQLSLREAILFANETEGEQTITFADNLAESEISLHGLPLFITGSDLIIEGNDITLELSGLDFSDSAANPFQSITGAIQVDSVGLEIRDLTLTGAMDNPGIPNGSAILGYNSTIALNNVHITDNNATGIIAFNSENLSLSNSSVEDNEGVAIGAYGTSFQIEQSRIINNQEGIRLFGESGVLSDSVLSDNGSTGIEVISGGDLEVERSQIIGNQGSGIDTSEGLLYVSSSNISGNAGTGIKGIYKGTIDNSTISGNGFGEDIVPRSGGIDSRGSGDPFTVEINNSTITGNIGQAGSSFVSGGVGSTGDGSYTTITNSIIAGNSIRGEGLDNITPGITSGGNNITDQRNVLDGPNDLNGIAVDRIFAETELVNGVLAGVAADNGGDTLTVALLADPNNPALNSANADLAPETDQRGFERVGGPDIGAFELQEEVGDPDTGTVVTTADDIVAADGQLSLREAILFANETEGEQTITFADNLAGSEISLSGLPLFITGSDLIIEGNDITLELSGLDFSDSAANPFQSITGAIQVDSVGLEIRDLTLTGAMDNPGIPNGSAILGYNSTIALNNVHVTDNNATGIIAFNSENLSLSNSSVEDNEGVAIGAYGTSFQIEQSRIINNQEGIRLFGESGVLSDSVLSDNGSTGIEIISGGDLEVERSQIVGNQGSGIDTSEGRLYVSSSNISGNAGTGIEGIYGGTIDNSTISGNGFGEDIVPRSSGIDSRGSGDPFTVEINNSTITDYIGQADDSMDQVSGGVDVRESGSPFVVEINNSTITGNIGQAGESMDQVSGGIDIRATGNNTTITNSIIAGNSIRGEGLDNFATTITSGGNNITDQRNVLDGPNDLNGIAVDRIFAETELVNGVLAGVATDNGGDTLTVALLADPNNPALNSANADLAPETDQRGFDRVGGPDIGAFELQDEIDSGSGDLNLVEGEAVNPNRINGVDPDILVGSEDGITLTFVSQVGAFNNSLGYYTYDDDGEIEDVGLVFAGDNDVSQGHSFELDQIEAGEQFGLFLIQDGLSRNPELSTDGDFLFVERGGLGEASIFDETPADLIFRNDHGIFEIDGSILHALNIDGENPLNPRNGLSALSQEQDGSLLVAFEDKNPGSSSNDSDFNDLVIRIDGLITTSSTDYMA